MTAESRREDSRAEFNLSQKLKGRGKRAVVCGTGHGPLCGPPHLDPLMHTALGLFHFAMPKVNASLWQNRLSGRRNICETGCASSAGGAWTLLGFFGRGNAGGSGRGKQKAASTKQPCPAHRIISSRRSFLSQTCPPRASVSPADRDLSPLLARRNTFPYQSEEGERCLVRAPRPTIWDNCPQPAAWWETLHCGRAEKLVLNLAWDLTCLAGVSILYSMYIAGIFFF